QALECAHENQVLHLDIKPDNILIDRAGRVKVTDFGLSELSGTSGYREPQGGTIGYMPLEQLLMQEVDQRTDLWALAALTYKLLTGLNPFVASDTRQSETLIQSSEIVLPSAFRDDLDPAADDVILRALAADKTLRHESIAEFYRELAPWLGDTQLGRRELRALADFEKTNSENTVAEAIDPEPDADIPITIPLWDRLRPRARNIFGRATSAVACAAMAWLGLSSLSAQAGIVSSSPLGSSGVDQSALGVASMLSSVTPPEMQLPLQLGIAALIALAGALVPQLGAVLALLILSAGIYLTGIPLLAIGLLLIAALWWLLIGRRSAADAIVVTALPLLAILWMPFALPLLAGYFISWKRSWIAALAGGLLMILIAPLTGSSDLMHCGPGFQVSSQAAWGLFVASIQNPQTWITLTAWILSAFVMALLCQWGTRMACFIGSILATAILIVATVVVPLAIGLTLGLGYITSLTACLSLSFIVVAVLTVIGVTPHSMIQEEE
ncbi:MAG: serine/threonine protein kinase, partial [Coriobacteriaceae bacterium]|nr:serine/threonine protein kinase [Coriobacteriaceae bacterium]